MIPEYVRITYIQANGEMAVTDFDVSGPVVEAERSLEAVRLLIHKDGGKITAAKFGTKVNGIFRERITRPVPLFIGGFRRMASYLHP